MCQGILAVPGVDLQEMIDNAFATKLPVFLQSGTYTITSPLKIYPNTRLVGANRNYVVIQGSGVDGYLVEADTPSYGGNIRNVEISGIQFKISADSLQKTKGAIGVITDANDYVCTEWKLHDLLINPTLASGFQKSGIYMENCWGTVFNDISARGSYAVAVIEAYRKDTGGSGVNALKFDHIYTSIDSANANILIGGSSTSRLAGKGISIRDCTLQGGDNGIFAKRVQGLIINGCYFESLNNAGIRIGDYANSFASSDSNIIGNTVIDASDGILFDYGVKALVYGNNFSDVTNKIVYNRYVGVVGMAQSESDFVYGANSRTAKTGFALINFGAWDGSYAVTETPSLVLPCNDSDARQHARLQINKSGSIGTTIFTPDAAS